MASVFLVSRPPCPADPKRHPTIVCDSARVARREAGDTAAGATVWQSLGKSKADRAFLLIRWKGLDVDYADDSTPARMPDGTWSGLHYPGPAEPPWTLLKGAVWWSPADVQKWVAKRGVLAASSLPEDRMPAVTARLIAESIEDAHGKSYGVRAFGYRQIPRLRQDVKRPAVLFLPGFGEGPDTEPGSAAQHDGTADAPKEKKPRKPRKKKGDPAAPVCRRCSECPDSTHHWLDNPDFGNDPAEAEQSVTATHLCKHCPALGLECTDCEGDGQTTGGQDCPACNGEGVVPVTADPALASSPA